MEKILPYVDSLEKTLMLGGIGGRRRRGRQRMRWLDQSQEDLLEKEMATHSSILAWEIPWIAEPGGL